MASVADATLAPSAVPAGPAAADEPDVARLQRVAGMVPLAILREFGSSLRGLEEAEAERRLVDFGENLPPAIPRRPLFAVIGQAALDPFVLVLLFLAAVSGLIGDGGTAAVTVALAAVSCGLRVGPEYRAGQAASARAPAHATTTTVVRRASLAIEPREREVPPALLVPGDIVRLVTGDPVPADLALLRASGFTVSQARLTGESMPVAKHAALSANPDPTAAADDGLPFDDSRLCLFGTTVVSGSATAVVVATGARTYFATRNNQLSYRRGRTTFDRDVRGISWTLIRLLLASIGIALVLTEIDRDSWLLSGLYGVAVAIGLIPEMLPVVVTTALVRALADLRSRAVLVKQLPTIHNLGAMDVACFDKTGTLTLGRLDVVGEFDPQGRPDPTPLMFACLTATFSLDTADPPAVDIVDDALLRCVDAGGDADRYIPVQALAFDATRRRSSVLLRTRGHSGRLLLITKGVAESMVDCCAKVRLDGQDVPLTPRRRRRLQAVVERLHARGDRVLAVAVGDRPLSLRRLRPADEIGLTLVGYVSLRDEAKPGSAAMVADLATSGVRVAVLTGDHPIAATRSCLDAGIKPTAVVCGRDIDGLNDHRLVELAERTNVFARVDARQKARIVTVLRQAGHTVGYVGDGVNDAPALQSADVAVSIDGAVDLARQTSDVVLRGEDLGALRDAIGTGRRTYANVIKYVKITVSSNLGNVCAVLAAGATMPFLPMLPAQILAQNLLFDLSQLSLAFDRTDAQATARPHTFHSHDLTRFVLCFGALNALADVATFLVLWNTIPGPTQPSGQALFHTGWFVENILSQLLAVHLLRSPAIRRWSWAAWPVLVTTIGLAALCVVVPGTPIGDLLDLCALPTGYFGWVTVILSGYALVLIVGKWLYRRAFGTWL
jgi:Mg2+-importing ATPase